MAVVSQTTRRACAGYGRFARSAPYTDAMRIVLFVHLVSMAFWLGGQLFLTAVAMPALRSDEPAARHALFRKVGRWFGVLSVPVLALLIGTGIWMMLHLDLDPGEVPALQHKLEALGVVLIGTLVHSVAGAQGRSGLSRMASFVTLGATLVVVWFATGL